MGTHRTIGRLGLWLALGIAIATPADAQALKPAIVAYSAAAAADWTSTAYALNHGAWEADPLLAWTGKGNASHVIPLGIALDVAVVLVTTKLIAPHHPRIAAGFLYVAAGTRLTEAGHNVYVGHHPVNSR